MATINTTFGFKDQISQNLVQLNNVLTQLSQTFNAVGNGAVGAGEKLDSFKEKGSGMGKLFDFNMATQAFNTVKGAVDSVTASIGEMTSAYNFQMEQETKLETVMRNHMDATAEQIQQVKDLASAQQNIGIYGDEMQLAGAQELATYIDDVDTLTGLMPVLNSMLAQGVGTSATARDMQSYATMLGKVMQGQVGGMSKRGYKFTEAEEEILKTGTELQKLEVLQRNVIGNFGDMNAALAQTPQGRIIQLNNTFGDLKEEIGKALVPFSQFFSIATMNWKIKWYQTIVKALNFLTEHINQAIIALGALGVAVLAVAAYFAILHKQEIVAAIASAAHWIATHAAMIGMIAVIVLVIAAIGALLVFSAKTFPAIGGFIGGLAGVAKETGAQIKYFFGWAIEGVVNGFLKMEKTIMNIYLKLFDFLLSGVQTVAGALDKVFGTSMASGVQEFRTALQDFSNAPAPEFKLGWEDNRRGYKAAWAEGQASGSAAGADLSEKMNAQIDKITAPFKNAMKGENLADGMKDAFNFDGEGNLMTANQNKLKIDDDFKRLLSEKALRDYQIKYSQITPSVTIQTMEVSKEADEDSVIETISNAIQGACSSILTGAA